MNSLRNLRKTLLKHLPTSIKCSKNIHLVTAKQVEKVSLRDQPVKFSTSKAKSWDSIDTFLSAKVRKRPKSQPFIIAISTFVFIIYFGFLRKENEIDEYISRPLEDLVPNVKEMTLRHQIHQYETMGLDTRSLKDALAKEVEKKKQK